MAARAVEGVHAHHRLMPAASPTGGEAVAPSHGFCALLGHHLPLGLSTTMDTFGTELQKLSMSLEPVYLRSGTFGERISHFNRGQQNTFSTWTV